MTPAEAAAMNERVSLLVQGAWEFLLLNADDDADAWAAAAALAGVLSAAHAASEDDAKRMEDVAVETLRASSEHVRRQIEETPAKLAGAPLWEAKAMVWSAFAWRDYAAVRPQWKVR